VDLHAAPDSAAKSSDSINVMSSLRYTLALFLLIGLSAQSTRARRIVNGTGTNLMLSIPAGGTGNRKVLLQTAVVVCTCTVTERLRTAVGTGGSVVTPVLLSGQSKPNNTEARTSATNSATGDLVYSLSVTGSIQLDLRGMEFGQLQGFVLTSSTAADFTLIYEEQ